MDFVTVLTYILAVVETAALLMALVFVTKAMKAKKEKDQTVRKGYYYKSLGFVLIYLALNVLRNSGWILPK